jgi:hypothetical protein
MNKNTNSQTLTTTNEQVISSFNQTEQDAKNAILIVSLLVNAFVLIGWVTLQVTSMYDAQIATFLFTR